MDGIVLTSNSGDGHFYYDPRFLTPFYRRLLTTLYGPEAVLPRMTPAALEAVLADWEHESILALELPQAKPFEAYAIIELNMLLARAALLALQLDDPLEEELLIPDMAQDMGLYFKLLPTGTRAFESQALFSASFDPDEQDWALGMVTEVATPWKQVEARSFAIRMLAVFHLSTPYYLSIGASGEWPPPSPPSRSTAKATVRHLRASLALPPEESSLEEGFCFAEESLFNNAILWQAMRKHAASLLERWFDAEAN